MAALAEHVPEHHRIGLRRVVLQADRRRALDQLGLGLAGHRHAGQVTLDVGREHRHAEVGKTFGEDLQRDRLAGAGGARHQAVPVGVGAKDGLRVLALADQDSALHARLSEMTLL